MVGGTKRARSRFGPLPPSRFDEIGLKGIYEKLGITTVFANPYNARAKVIEQFFLEMQESFEKLLPSYMGTNIENKPARLRRNEKFHSEIHQEYTPTIQYTIEMINSWLEYKNSLPCPNYRTKSIKEMLESIEKQEINPRGLDDLMLAQEVKTITSQGIRFLKSDYYNDALYGLRQKVIIKYSLFDLSYINVYTISGKFLCRADRIKLKDIMVTDVENFRKVMQNKQISERRIKNILTLLSQIIKHFQNEGYINKTCIFEVKRIADIPKRQIQILTPEQLMQLFKILKKKYTYLLPIVQKLITLKQPLNTLLTGSEQEKKHLKRKIRNIFIKSNKNLV